MPFSTDGKGPKLDDANATTWFHGSPERLTVLAARSAITRNRQLAEAFSHKPTRLSVANDGTVEHNGTVPGYLYAVDEEVGIDDAAPHPAVSGDDPWEWTTTRDLKLRLIGRTTQ